MAQTAIWEWTEVSEFADSDVSVFIPNAAEHAEVVVKAFPFPGDVEIKAFPFEAVHANTHIWTKVSEVVIVGFNTQGVDDLWIEYPEVPQSIWTSY